MQVSEKLGLGLGLWRSARERWICRVTKLHTVGIILSLFCFSRSRGFRHSSSSRVLTSDLRESVRTAFRFSKYNQHCCSLSLAGGMKPPPSGMEMDDLPKGELPPHLELQRTRVVCAADAPSYVSPLSVCLTVCVCLVGLFLSLIAWSLGVSFLPVCCGANFYACAHECRLSRCSIPEPTWHMMWTTAYVWRIFEKTFE